MFINVHAICNIFVIANVKKNSIILYTEFLKNDVSFYIKITKSEGTL